VNPLKQQQEQRDFRGSTHGWGSDAPTRDEPRTGQRDADWDSSIIGFRLVSDHPVQHYRGGSWTWGDERAARPDADVSIRAFSFSYMGFRLSRDEGGGK